MLHVLKTYFSHCHYLYIYCKRCFLQRSSLRGTFTCDPYQEKDVVIVYAVATRHNDEYGEISVSSPLSFSCSHVFMVWLPGAGCLTPVLRVWAINTSRSAANILFIMKNENWFHSPPAIVPKVSKPIYVIIFGFMAHPFPFQPNPSCN